MGLGELGQHMPMGSWILIFGGATREGNRRARRAIRNAVDGDTSVLWFDGFGERGEGRESGRVPLDVSVPDDRVVVIDYSVEERGHWLNRMVDTVPDVLLKPVVKAENLTRDTRGKQTPVLTRMRRALERILALIKKKILKKIAVIFGGRVGWKMVRGDVIHLSEHASAPSHIIFGDDNAMTLAWYAARLWPNAKTAMEFDRS